ncbi:hypothetical protein CONLIGDRAFT_685805 [Coniochaeta ligniaria NRRL 30616]|uniref:Uncharacterized protein n=1 Tax=Coniochaeta ligniaria NRRL 30616 TaxID=1408157 RepID=A0A1J7J9H0_9PEZI|nr:hypothetical protein CONLIGDRAFT_685805 [Coniochaeta ligniaria NRRL 30616]
MNLYRGAPTPPLLFDNPIEHQIPIKNRNLIPYQSVTRADTPARHPQLDAEKVMDAMVAPVLCFSSVWLEAGAPSTTTDHRAEFFRPYPRGRTRVISLRHRHILGHRWHTRERRPVEVACSAFWAPIVVLLLRSEGETGRRTPTRDDPELWPWHSDQAYDVRLLGVLWRRDNIEDDGNENWSNKELHVDVWWHKQGTLVRPDQLILESSAPHGIGICKGMEKVETKREVAAELLHPAKKVCQEKSIVRDMDGGKALGSLGLRQVPRQASLSGLRKPSVSQGLDDHNEAYGAAALLLHCVRRSSKTPPSTSNADPESNAVAQLDWATARAISGAVLLCNETDKDARPLSDHPIGRHAHQTCSLGTNKEAQGGGESPARSLRSQRVVQTFGLNISDDDSFEESRPRRGLPARVDRGGLSGPSVMSHHLDLANSRRQSRHRFWRGGRPLLSGRRVGTAAERGRQVLNENINLRGLPSLRPPNWAEVASPRRLMFDLSSSRSMQPLSG